MKRIAWAALAAESAGQCGPLSVRAGLDRRRTRSADRGPDGTGRWDHCPFLARPAGGLMEVTGRLRRQHEIVSGATPRHATPRHGAARFPADARPVGVASVSG
jgi:hypothetical protein